jgi:hypothetical protein
MVRVDLAHHVLGVACLRDDLEAFSLQHARHTLPEQDVVVRDHRAQGRRGIEGLVQGRR